MTDIFEIKPATIDDAALILSFIKELAEYEKLLHEVIATEEILQETLFGENAHAEVVIGVDSATNPRKHREEFLSAQKPPSHLIQTIVSLREVCAELNTFALRSRFRFV